MFYFDIQWRRWQAGRDARGLYFDHTGGGPKWIPNGYFEICFGRLRVRFN